MDSSRRKFRFSIPCIYINRDQPKIVIQVINRYNALYNHTHTQRGKNGIRSGNKKTNHFLKKKHKSEIKSIKNNKSPIVCVCQNFHFLFLFCFVFYIIGISKLFTLFCFFIQRLVHKNLYLVVFFHTRAQLDFLPSLF